MGLTVKNLICRVRVTLPQETIGSGRPLELGLLSRMEALLGERFDGVMLHTDGGAGAVARRLGADAFVVDGHVYFGQGQFDPVTSRGIGLLAHELVHRRHEREGTPEAEAEQEARRAEREASGAQEAVYLETAEEESAVGGEKETGAREPERRRRPEPLPPAQGDLEEAVTAKVLAMVRAELVLERERRGVIGPSVGRLPL